MRRGSGRRTVRLPKHQRHGRRIEEKRMHYQRPRIERMQLIAQMETKRSCPAGKICIEAQLPD